MSGDIDLIATGISALSLSFAYVTLSLLILFVRCKQGKKYLSFQLTQPKLESFFLHNFLKMVCDSVAVTIEHYSKCFAGCCSRDKKYQVSLPPRGQSFGSTIQS